MGALKLKIEVKTVTFNAGLDILDTWHSKGSIPHSIFYYSRKTRYHSNRILSVVDEIKKNHSASVQI